MFEKYIKSVLKRNEENVQRINTLSVALNKNSAITTETDLSKLRSIKDELKAEYKKCLEELDELTDICGICEIELSGFKFFGKKGGE